VRHCNNTVWGKKDGKNVVNFYKQNINGKKEQGIVRIEASSTF